MVVDFLSMANNALQFGSAAKILWICSIIKKGCKRFYTFE